MKKKKRRNHYNIHKINWIRVSVPIFYYVTENKLIKQFALYIKVKSMHSNSVRYNLAEAKGRKKLAKQARIKELQ